MVGVLFLLFVATLEAGCEKVGRVGTNLAAEQIQRVTEPEIDVLLNYFEWDTTEFPNIAFLHELCSASYNTAQSSVANKHVMCFFSEHELAGASQGLETRFGER